MAKAPAHRFAKFRALLVTKKITRDEYIRLFRGEYLLRGNEIRRPHYVDPYRTEHLRRIGAANSAP